MKLSSHARGCLERANAMGYFPTPQQADQIAAKSCERYAMLRTDGLVPLRGVVNNDVVSECDGWAVRRVMEEGKDGKLVYGTLIGESSEEMIADLCGVLRSCAGRVLRIQIDEV